MCGVHHTVVLPSAHLLSTRHYGVGSATRRHNQSFLSTALREDMVRQTPKRQPTNCRMTFPLHRLPSGHGGRCAGGLSKLHPCFGSPLLGSVALAVQKVKAQTPATPAPQEALCGLALQLRGSVCRTFDVHSLARRWPRAAKEAKSQSPNPET